MRFIEFELKHYDTVTRLVRAVVHPWLAVTKAGFAEPIGRPRRVSHRMAIPRATQIDEPYAVQLRC